MTCEEILKKYFGYDSFRPQQKEIIDNVLQMKDTVVLMPTGGGKSVCYQVPALAMEGTCIVVSPLIALMKDQVEGLKANGVAAAFINSSLSPREEDVILSQCLQGKIKILYLSPEKLLTSINTFLRTLSISLIAIDEAHCISQWGHDFRPEYTRLKIIRQEFPNVPLIALTATADKVTRKDIITQLSLNEPGVFIASFDRPNLSLEVKSNLKTKAKIEEIAQFIIERKEESGIIYCFSRTETERVSAELNSRGIKSLYYHAGMGSEDRSAAQEAFISDEAKVICATIAFGMGIDKSNVRWVIHYNLPKNIEGYYQEIGRAGRDGYPSETILYYNLKDIILLSRFAKESGQPELNYEKLKRMQQFAEARVCRRRILISYFGEPFTQNCNNCDVCHNPPEYSDGTILAQKALSALIRTGEKVGVNMLINILRGSREADLLEKGYHTIKTYGAGREHSFDAWQAFILQFMQLGLVEMAYDEGYTLKATAVGHDVLRGNEKVQLVTPLVRQPIAKESIRAAEKGSHLFERLRALRKKIADSQGIAPYIVFTDKTLHEMATRIPHTKMQLLDISGVTERKYDLCGEAFLQILREYESHVKHVPVFDPAEHLTIEKVYEYAQQMRDADIRVSPHTIGKILVGSNRDFVTSKVRELPFYGLLKDKMTYRDIGPIIKKHFESQKEERVKKAKEDDIFSGPVTNNLPVEVQKKMANEIRKMHLLRPDETITNDYILEQRKTFRRAYEPWGERETELFNQAVALTNDLQVLEHIFQRNAGSIRSFYKKQGVTTKALF